jgi:hypothetical protein
MIRAGTAIAFVMALAGCSDGATRIAFDIEEAAEAFARGRSASATIEHVPERWPDGCAGAYTLQLSARSVLVIWCKDDAAGTASSSHATTYHLRFVEVPRTFRIDKPAGRPVWIDIARGEGKPVVTGLR